MLDNELEDSRIRLVSERDFYPKICFKAFLATEGSKEQMRQNLDGGKQSDGLSELEADVDTIFDFIRENSQSSIGMCSKLELESFLTEFMKQRLSKIFVPEAEQSRCRTNVIKYLDFLALISSKNRDFNELMLQRQADYEVQ